MINNSDVDLFSRDKKNALNPDKSQRIERVSLWDVRTHKQYYWAVKSSCITVIIVVTETFDLNYKYLKSSQEWSEGDKF